MSIGNLNGSEVFWKKNKNSYNPHTPSKNSNRLLLSLSVFKKRIIKYTLLLLLLIANTSWWSYVDRPHSVKPASEKLDCVSYNPYRNEYSLDENKKHVSEETIDADMAIIAKRFRCVRTYTTLHGMDAVPKVAEKYGLTVIV